MHKNIAYAHFQNEMTGNASCSTSICGCTFVTALELLARLREDTGKLVIVKKGISESALHIRNKQVYNKHSRVIAVTRVDAKVSLKWCEKRLAHQLF